MFGAFAGGHWLAVLAVVACLVAGGAAVAYLGARRRLAQMATALDNMSQGLCMFDAGRASCCAITAISKCTTSRPTW